jgi:hypothetical protein
MNTLLFQAARRAASVGVMLLLGVALSVPAAAQKKNDPLDPECPEGMLCKKNPSQSVKKKKDDPNDPECPESMVCNKPQTRALNKMDVQATAKPKSTIAAAPGNGKEAEGKPQTRALKKKPKKESCDDMNGCR